MQYCTYNYFLPELVATALTSAVRRFAAERGLRSDARYHDMPIWMISGQDPDWIELG